MPSEVKDRKRRGAAPDRLAVAFLRVAILAPGGLVAGYAVGRLRGRVLSGCPLSGPCGEALPVLLVIPTSVIGFGVGGALAAARVNCWWEGVLVWGAGIVSLFSFVVLIGWLGVDSRAGRFVSLFWLLAAAVLALFSRRPLSAGKSAE